MAPRDGERNEASTSGVFPPPPLPKPSWMGTRRARRGNQTPRETARARLQPRRCEGRRRLSRAWPSWRNGQNRCWGKGLAPRLASSAKPPRERRRDVGTAARPSLGRWHHQDQPGAGRDPPALGFPGESHRCRPRLRQHLYNSHLFFFSTPTPEKCQGSNPHRQPFSPALCQGQSPSPCPAMCQTPAEPPVPTSPPARPIVPPAIPGQNLSDTTRRREATAHPPIPQKSKSGSSFGGTQSPKNKPQAGDVSPSPPLHCRDPPPAGAAPPPRPPACLGTTGAILEIPVTTTLAGKTRSAEGRHCNF